MMVVMTLFVRATRLVSATPQFLDPRHRIPLNRSTSNLIGVITSETSPHTQTLVFLSLEAVAEIFIIYVYFYHPHLTPLLFYSLRFCTDLTV